MTGCKWASESDRMPTVWTAVGIAISEIETPTPNDNRILVRVLAASVNPLESGMM